MRATRAADGAAAMGTQRPHEGAGAPKALHGAAAALAAAALAAAAAARALRARRRGARRTRVVVVGAGFAGCQLARDLRATCDVTVVADRGYFEFAPGVPRALVAGRGAARGAVQALDRTLGGCTVLRATGPYGLSQDALAFTDADGTEHELAYDFVVVATGASYASPIQDNRGGAEERAASLAAFAKSAPRGRTATVVGAGAVGVEAAAELASTGASVALRDTAPAILPRLGDSAGAAFARRRAEAFFARHGVKLELGPDAAGAAAPDADDVLWCVGARPNADAVRTAGDGPGLARHPARGGYMRDAGTLRALSPDGSVHDRVFVLGDCADKPPAQYLASFAHWEAEHVAASILAAAGVHRRPPLPYEAPPSLVNLSLGRWDGVFLACDPAGGGGCRVLCWGALAALLKSATWWWFLRWLPIPYGAFAWLRRALVRRPRRPAAAAPAAS